MSTGAHADLAGEYWEAAATQSRSLEQF